MQLLLAGPAPRVLCDDAGEHALPWRDAALLAWLALEGPTPRARLAALLWPHSPTDAARNTLRQRLFQLRRLVGADLVAGSATLALAPQVRHDLDDADTVLGDAEPEVDGELAAWLQQQRLRRRSRLVLSLAELAAAAETARDWSDALAHAQELLALQPLNEEAHRRVMRLHYLAGDPAAALLAFDACEQALKTELGLRPSPETLALLRTVERSAVEPAPAQAVVVAGGRPAAAGGPVPAAVLRPPRLVGRSTERRVLSQAWQQRQGVLVAGEAGLGKSRLLAEVAAAAPGPVVSASARPGDRDVVYASASRLLRALPREQWAVVAAPLRRELARLLPELAPPDAPLPSAKADGEARTRLANAVAAVLDGSACGSSAAGWMLDDLHFADDASVELLRQAAGSPGCWALAAREAELAPAARAWWDALAAEPQTARVALGPLSQPQVAELLDTLDLPGLSGEAAAPALWRHTGGNPLFLLETVKAWLAEGTPALPQRLPAAPSVDALITRRISRLSPPAVKLARCAAIAGADFSIELAAQVMGLRTLDLADPWAELEAAQVLHDGAFAHDLIFEAARASVPQPVARQLHAEIAAFVAARGGEPARLAEHWALAGRWALAAQAWREAAEKAHAAGRIVEQAQWLQQAADALQRAGDKAARFDVLRQRAEVLASNDLGLDAQAAVDELQHAAQGELQQLQALATRLELAATRFEIDEALKLAPQALAEARRLGQQALELRLAVVWSGVLGDARRTAEGVAALEPYLAQVQAGGLPAQQQWEFWEAWSLALDYAGRLAESAHGWQTCQTLARQAQRPDWLWRSLSNAAAGAAKMGRVAQACELSQQARQIALSTGEVGRLRLMQMQTPHAHRLRDVGRYAEALPLLEEALEAFRTQGSATDRAMTAQRLALLYLFLGQPARAQQALALFKPGVPPGITMFQRVLQAELAFATGADALTPTREALAMMGNEDDVFHRIATLFASRIVPPDEGEALAAGLAVWAGVRGRQGLAMSAHVRAAACAAAQGEHRRALPHVQAALALVVEHQPESFYLAELWWVAGRVLLALGRSGEAQQALRAGRDWVMRVHDEQVPPLYRESFLHRNGVNRELLALAAMELGA